MQNLANAIAQLQLTFCDCLYKSGDPNPTAPTIRG